MSPQAAASGQTAAQREAVVRPTSTGAVGAPHRPAWIYLVLCLVLLIFVPCLVNAVAWIGRPFSGFLFLENGIVVSIGRMEWAQPQHRRTGWTRVLAVDDQPVSDGRAIHDHVQAAGIGRQAIYTFRGGTEMFRQAVEVRRFAWSDFLELFAPLLVIGLLMALFGAIVVLRRPDALEARALFALCVDLGLLIITGPDQYWPYRFSWIYFLSFCCVPPAIVQLALTYPQRSQLLRHRGRVAFALYTPFMLLGTALYLYRFAPTVFLPLLYTLYFLEANALLLYIGGLVLGLIGGIEPRRPIVLALAGVVGASAITILVSVTYPLLQRPISPIMLLGPWLLLPALTGVAFLRFPVLTRPAGETSA